MDKTTLGSSTILGIRWILPWVLFIHHANESARESTHLTTNQWVQKDSVYDDIIHFPS